MAVEDTQEFKAWDEASAQWQAIFDKVKQDCPDKNHVLHRQAKDEFEKAKAHFTGCQQASENVPATEQHASAYPALLPIWWSWSPWALNCHLTEAICVVVLGRFFTGAAWRSLSRAR